MWFGDLLGRARSGCWIYALGEGPGIGSPNDRACSGRGQMGHGKRAWDLPRRLRVLALKARLHGVRVTTGNVIPVFEADFS